MIKSILHLIWRHQISKSFMPMGLLLNRTAVADFSKLPSSRFIRYSEIIDEYGEGYWRVLVRHNGVIRTLSMPYKIEVNYVDQPQSKILIDGPVSDYAMPTKLRELTNSNLDAFLMDRPLTFDGEIVRVCDFVERAAGYQCNLQRASYYDAVRTELTLDFPIVGLKGQTLRSLMLEPGKRLPSFKSSVMANALGASAIIFLEKTNGPMVFCRQRKPNLGIFEGMFGSVGGVCEYPPDSQIADLENLAQVNIRREFEFETGLKSDSSVVDRVIPLAFCRDHIRGGKPQFFYLIKLRHNLRGISFRNRNTIQEGPTEFHTKWIGNRLGSKDWLSPEFMTNLLLALVKLHREQGISTEILDLGSA